MYFRKAMLENAYPICIYDIVIMWLYNKYNAYIMYIYICIYVETASSTNDLDESLTTDFHCIRPDFCDGDEGQDSWCIPGLSIQVRLLDTKRAPCSIVLVLDTHPKTNMVMENHHFEQEIRLQIGWFSIVMFVFRAVH